MKATIQTNLGEMTVRLLADDVPRTVRNFHNLVVKGTYDDTRFYRVVKDAYIQGGIGYGQAASEPRIASEGLSQTF